MNTRPTGPRPGPGVAPPSGYTTSTDSMSSTARTVHDAAEDAQGDVKELKPTKLGDADFGVKHKKWHGDYAKAIDLLGTGSDAMCANLIAFSGQLGGAGTSYVASDAAASGTVNTAGSTR